MVRFAKTNAAECRQAVLDAIKALQAEDLPVNVSSVARTADVSRQYIHTKPDLLREIENAKKGSRPSRRPRAAAPVADGLRADRSALLAKVAKQKDTIAKQASRISELESQRERWLGDQLAGSAAVDPELLAELRITNERLVADLGQARRRIAELERLNSLLSADLRASRQAHSEDLARLGDAEGRVLPFRSDEAEG
jgi:hypothetical protein